VHEAPAVRADDIRAAHGILPAGGGVPDHGGHRLLALVEIDQLVTEPDPPRRELVGSCLEQRFESDLWEVHLSPRARPAPVLVRSACTPALHPRQAAPVVRFRTGEAGVEGRGRHLLGRRAAPSDRVRHPDVIERLHRPLVQDVRLGQV
jgi:hypothetical protein